MVAAESHFVDVSVLLGESQTVMVMVGNRTTLNVECFSDDVTDEYETALNLHHFR